VPEGANKSAHECPLLAISTKAATGHFETKSDAYRCASIGLILLQELTFWRWGSKVGA
jgi:hypothetical protein